MKRRECMVVVLAAFAVGCAPGRMADLADCGKASVGIGFGLEAHAKVGFLTHPSLGIGSMTSRVGHESRVRTAAWGEVRCVWPVSSLMDTFLAEDPMSLNVSFVSGRGPHNNPLEVGYLLPLLVYAGMHADNETYRPLAFKEATDLQLGGTLLLVSARVGVNPLEIVDFLAGLVGLDPAGDDPKPAPPDEARDAQEPAADSDQTPEAPETKFEGTP